jgi:hypothetical protein
VLLPIASGTLRADLYDPKRDLLIEAKAASSRGATRYAIGQLLDYQRAIKPLPSLATPLPDRPPPDLLDLLRGGHITTI